MEIHVGERTVKGVIKERDEARRIYEQAKKAGHVTALLDQERPNIFTQSVANILPGNRIDVRIRYFEALPYRDQNYTFSFPMVVGPRFIPGAPTSSEKRGWSPDTTDVPDASKITPPVLRPGQRSGHDISLEVKLATGTRLVHLASPSHKVDISRKGGGRAHIELRSEDSIPNKDFVLRYGLDGNAPRVVLLPHRKDNHGYFLVLIQPEARPAPDKITPKEMVFVVDGSGSMRGLPMGKVKEAMRHSLKNLNPDDTFQIIRFSNRAETFSSMPVPATEANIQRGLGYIESLSGRGGTIMLEGVRAALTPPKDPER
jgi:Ca-activated chloride channel family protein